MANGKLTAALQWVHRKGLGGGIPDSELLQRFVAGHDEAAFELLLWRHQRLVFGVCRRVLHNIHDAEDAFQAAFLVLARKGHTIGHGESLPGWLYRVAYRCALTVRKRQVRREQALVPERDLAAAADHAALSAERRELRDILDEELHRLPEQFRVPAVLCYLAGKTVDEAAEQLGCPRGTVASRLARARERLRRRLARRGVALPAGAAALALADATASAAPDALIRASMTQFQHLATGRAASGAAAAVANTVVRAMFLRKFLIGSMLLALLAGVLLIGGNIAIEALAQLPDDRPALAGPALPVAPAQTGKPAPKAGAGPDEQPAPLPAAVDYLGRLEASQKLNVCARISGVIDKVAVKVGDMVKRGDLVFEMDARAARATLEQAKANLAQVEAKCQLATATLARIQELLAKQAVGRDEVEQRRADLAVAKAELRAARAQFEQAELGVGFTRITAPIDGRVATVNAATGDFVGNDKTAIHVTLIRVDPIRLDFNMDERTFVRYEELTRAGKIAGIKLHVRIPAADEKGFPHEAKFEAFAPTVNATTGTIAVHGSMANPQRRFVPGMSVQVRVTFAPATKR